MQTHALSAILRQLEERGHDHPIAVAGAAKSQSPENVRAAIDAGLRIVACNYVQEGALLRSTLAESPVEWHFIGHIQSRKVKDLLGYDCVQSLDRLEVAEAFERRLQAVGRKLRVLVEVNVGAEPQKSGVLPAALPQFLEALKQFPALDVRGLMGMPPPLLPVERRRPFFADLLRLFEQAKNGPFPHFDMLSMGTSEDYLVAAEEGSTMVRLGTVLFGERPGK